MKPEIKNNNIIVNKPKNKPSNKKIILDEDDENENPDIKRKNK